MVPVSVVLLSVFVVVVQEAAVTDVTASIYIYIYI